jgi:hypothetical protein
MNIYNMNEFSNIKEVPRMAHNYKRGKIFPSNRKNKKYMIRNPNGKMICFGASGYADYTAHKDKERRERFRKRNHKWASSSKWTASCLSYNLLWGD